MVLISRSRPQLGAVPRVTRRAVSSSPPPSRGGARHSFYGSSWRWTGTSFGWGRAAIVAVPLCGVALKEHMDADTRDWLSRRLLLPVMTSAVCEAAMLTPAELAEELARGDAVRDKLLSELERVRAERDALDEQRKTLQSLLAERAKLPASTVVQQEVKYSESWDAKIAELLAARTTERVLEVIQQPVASGKDATSSSSMVLGIITDQGVLDVSKEPALAPDVSLNEAQERLRALLLELHHRTRLEGVRVREAIKATEEAATRQHLLALSHKMSEQEAYVQQVTEKRAVEIKEKTVESIKSGDMEFQRQLRQQWAKCNEEAQKLSEHTSKLKQLHYNLAHNDALENSKKELADFLSKEAGARSGEIEETGEKLKRLGEIVQVDAASGATAQLLARLNLALLGLESDVAGGRGVSGHVSTLTRVAQGDLVVAAASEWIGGAGGPEPVASEPDLQQRYVLAAEEAVRRELVAGVGGVVGEMLGTARLTLLKLQGPVVGTVDHLVDGSDTKAVLCRGHYYVRQRALHKAIQEIEGLEGSASYAMSGWVQEARRRVIVEQATRLLTARVNALTAVMPRAGTSAP